jgi:hypothetical protein
MPHILTQKDFRKVRALKFCYLCGQPLKNGAKLNVDHCPPKGVFKAEDRQNYSLTVDVHEACNTFWHKYDEQFAILYEALHGGEKIEAKRDMEIFDVRTATGSFPALKGVPFLVLAIRVAQCAHALMYGECLDEKVRRHVQVPLPEADPNNSNEMMPVKPIIQRAAETLCTAQKTNTHNSLVAYNGKFKFVSTWVQADDGTAICMFAFDIYRLAPLGWDVPGFPRCYVAYYLTPRPQGAAKCSDLQIVHTPAEVRYPILI